MDITYRPSDLPSLQGTLCHLWHIRWRLPHLYSQVLALPSWQHLLPWNPLVLPFPSRRRLLQRHHRSHRWLCTNLASDSFTLTFVLLIGSRRLDSLSAPLHDRPSNRWAASLYRESCSAHFNKSVLHFRPLQTHDAWSIRPVPSTFQSVQVLIVVLLRNCIHV